MASITTCSHCFKIMIINCLKLIYETLMVFFGSFFFLGGGMGRKRDSLLSGDLLSLPDKIMTFHFIEGRKSPLYSNYQLTYILFPFN